MKYLTFIIIFILLKSQPIFAQKKLTDIAIHIKGQLIADQQIDCPALGSFYLAAYVYLPSSSDSILLSIKSPGKPIQDTILPIDFSYLEFKNWINSVIPTLHCTNEQTENNLSSFVVQCARTAPIFASISAKQKADLNTDSIVSEQKLAPQNTNKKDTSNTILADTNPESAKQKTDSLAKSPLNNITLLNAFNFDFSGKLGASYLGLFNIFAPNCDSMKFLGKRHNWGFIAGIEKINYTAANINGNDSGQNVYLYQYVLKNPLSYNSSNQKIDSGAPYYYQYNKYTLTSKNTVWSFYFEPIWRTNLIPFNLKDPKVGVYLLIHTELLVNKVTYNINIQTLYDSSAKYNPANPSYPMHQYLPSQYSSNSTIVTGNIGVGSVLYAEPFIGDSTSHFYFQVTGGVSINSPNLTNITTLTSRSDSGRTIISLPSINTALVNPTSFINEKAQLFYLIRAAFLQSLSNKTELIIGMTIRGLLPSQTPQYAAYLGLNLDLNILTDLFSSK